MGINNMTEYLNQFGLFKEDLPEGWFYNNFHVLQKTKGRVYCYIQAYIGFYCLQLYERKNVGICDLEIRSTDLQEMMEQADKWLERYKDGDMQQIHADWWSPKNPKGYWALEYKR